MTHGVGGSTIEEELGRMRSMREGAAPIGDEERRQRIAKAQSLMREKGIAALYLDASTSTFYFTGLRLKGSERLHGAVVPAEGEIVYLTPAFEEAKRLLELVLSDLYPGYGFAYYEMGRLLRSHGLFPSSIEQFDKAKSVDAKYRAVSDKRLLGERERAEKMDRSFP